MKLTSVFFGAAHFHAEDAAMMACAKALIEVLEATDYEPDMEHPIEVMSAHLTEPETEGLTSFRAQLIAAGLDPGLIEAQVVLARRTGGEVIVVAYLPDEPHANIEMAPGIN